MNAYLVDGVRTPIGVWRRRAEQGSTEGVACASAALARRGGARATCARGRDSAVSRREKLGTPKGTHRDDGEARVRDARRGGGRAELRAALKAERAAPPQALRAPAADAFLRQRRLRLALRALPGEEGEGDEEDGEDDEPPLGVAEVLL